MAEEPDRIRDDIERTRATLARDVDRLADRTSPTRVAQRRWTAVKEKVRGVSDKVMGTSYDTTHSVQDMAGQAGDKASYLANRVSDKASDAAGEVADTVRRAPRAVASKTQGNPIAAGVIAFGVGLLAASLIPESDVERRAARQLRDNAGDLVDRVREPLMESAQQVKDEMSGTVREAVGQVKDTAMDAAQTTAQEAKSSAQDAAEQVRSAT
ncbi:DUF3618 domain-containing protein [Planosporangium thailandense]|uniref:DUF3618 domain-containing protein n=1 Tax=Planosporangium thailandense TaxID=765197 RepID=A0ABX0XU08_9ACTN|nr:DUF3618 domain-containing protein [Planosporangium thailandense]NJC69480.1 DUF3618 domain-containing protein [Planosporangium thailandense]